MTRLRTLQETLELLRNQEHWLKVALRSGWAIRSKQVPKLEEERRQVRARIKKLELGEEERCA